MKDHDLSDFLAGLFVEEKLAQDDYAALSIEELESVLGIEVFTKSAVDYQGGFNNGAGDPEMPSSMTGECAAGRRATAEEEKKQDATATPQHVEPKTSGEKLKLAISTATAAGGLGGLALGGAVATGLHMARKRRNADMTKAVSEGIRQAKTAASRYSLFDRLSGGAEFHKEWENDQRNKKRKEDSEAKAKIKAMLGKDKEKKSAHVVILPPSKGRGMYANMDKAVTSLVGKYKSGGNGLIGPNQLIGPNEAVGSAKRVAKKIVGMAKAADIKLSSFKPGDVIGMKSLIHAPAATVKGVAGAVKDFDKRKLLDATKRL